MRAEIARALRPLGAALTPELLSGTAALYAGAHANATFAAAPVRGLPYGEHERQRLDLFPAFGQPAPALVFVHGGNFIRGDRSTPGSPFYDNVGRFAAAHGWTGVTISYRLAPEHGYPAGAQDLAAALAWLRDEGPGYGVDPARIVLVGQSAGAAHVSDVLRDPAFDEARRLVRGAVLLSGIYDPGTFEHQAIVETYYGAEPPKTATAEALAASGTPLFAVVAEHDPAAWQRQFAALVASCADTIGRVPSLAWLRDHNHVSEIYQLGSDDDDLAAPLLDVLMEWIA
jgi:acetyl esterase/lipase